MVIVFICSLNTSLPSCSSWQSSPISCDKTSHCVSATPLKKRRSSVTNREGWIRKHLKLYLLRTFHRIWPHRTLACERWQGKNLPRNIRKCFRTQTFFLLHAFEKKEPSWENCQAWLQPYCRQVQGGGKVTKKKKNCGKWWVTSSEEQKMIIRESWGVPSRVMMPHMVVRNLQTRNLVQFQWGSPHSEGSNHHKHPENLRAPITHSNNNTSLPFHTFSLPCLHRS